MYKIAWTSQKVVYAVWGALVSFTQEVHTAMLGLLICIIADTITGFWAASHRGERRTSAKLSNVVRKILTYFSSALILLVVEKMVFPTYVGSGMELARMAFGAFAMIEAYSFIENLRDITGFRVFEVITQFSFKKIEEKTGLDAKALKNAAKKGRK